MIILAKKFFQGRKTLERRWVLSATEVRVLTDLSYLTKFYLTLFKISNQIRVNYISNRMKSLFFLFIFNAGILSAQLSNIEVDREMARIPKSKTSSISSISKYIQENFKSDSNKIRAVYFFTTNHIDYDVDNMFAINFNETNENKITFSDNDTAVDITGITSIINSPKDEKNLEELEESRAFADDEDEDERLTIGDNIKLDIIDINDLNKPVELKPPVLDFEILT